MGSIDLDPASSEFANKIVQATMYYTKDTNGLDKAWFGNVWLNPPYCQPLIFEFAEGVINRRNQFYQCIVLVNNATETKFGQILLKHSNAVCFLKPGVKFLDANGEPVNSPLQGQMCLYYGENRLAFNSVFSELGTVLLGAIGIRPK